MYTVSLTDAIRELTEVNPSVSKYFLLFGNKITDLNVAFLSISRLAETFCCTSRDGQSHK